MAAIKSIPLSKIFFEKDITAVKNSIYEKLNIYFIKDVVPVGSIIIEMPQETFYDRDFYSFLKDSKASHIAFQLLYNDAVKGIVVKDDIVNVRMIVSDELFDTSTEFKIKLKRYIDMLNAKHTRFDNFYNNNYE